MCFFFVHVSWQLIYQSHPEKSPHCLPPPSGKYPPPPMQACSLLHPAPLANRQTTRNKQTTNQPNTHTRTAHHGCKVGTRTAQHLCYMSTHGDGMAWHDMAWHGMVWCGMARAKHTPRAVMSTVAPTMVRCGVVWCGMAWDGIV